MAFDSQQRYGVFGGTFDPIHLGHIATIRQVMTMTGLDQIRYIPTSVPPHRPQPGASPEQRLEMVRIAIADEPGFVLDDREIKREGASYTIDTIESLQEDYPKIKFSLILGLDALLKFDTWHRWQDLLKMLDIMVMVRPGWQQPSPLPSWWKTATVDRKTNRFNYIIGKIAVISIDPLPLSASQIRTNIIAKADVSAALHPGVWTFIKSQKLYA